MLVVKNQEHYEKVLAFADSVGKRAQLDDRLAFLDGYAQGRAKCILYADFAPYSFEFVLLDAKTGAKWFNGGLLYFGPGDDGSGDPQFSVRLDSRESGWEIHT